MNENVYLEYRMYNHFIFAYWKEKLTGRKMKILSFVI